MRTSNPMLNDKAFSRAQAGTAVMTLPGTVNKTAMLLALTLITALFTWGMAWESMQATDGSVPMNPLLVPLMIGGAVAGFVLALICTFKKTAAPIIAPLYALAEGLFIGGISAQFEVRYPGIVLQAVGLTFGTLFMLLFAYRSGLIKATENFKLGVVAATGAIFLLYLVNIGMRLFGFDGMGFIHDSGPIGIGFSLVVVGIAALNLVLDFDFIEGGVAQGAPKYMEWYAAFGLLVTLVWLYIEMLRLLSKLRK
ncbi:MAG TPA: Bax inhibitor-1/YccA family protein [Dongiaceae bacterium]|nr:Bax inhibitor-1/YccA family protein [Dongiaceae bacterium]